MDRGSAPILAVFLLGTIVVIFTVSSMLKSGYERQVKELVLKQAGLVALGTLKSVEVEVNQYLRSAACSAMFEVGEVGGDENEVLQKVMEAARELENAWSFPSVSLSLPIENLGEFLSWTPDGSLEISGLLPASVKHVMGPEAWGIKLEVTGIPRFRRMRQLSYLVIPQENFLDFLCQLNENFREEGFFFEATSQGIVIKDLWAERVLVSYLT